MRKQQQLIMASLLAALALSAACAGSSSQESATAGDAAESPADAAPSSTLAFDDMSPAQKMDHMKKVIVPQMGEVFARFDADEFDSFKCTTCHGPGARSGDFEMPSESLPALDAQEMEEHPEWTKFMKEEVTPKMAELLGEPVYDPATQSGFGCYDCHTQK